MINLEELDSRALPYTLTTIENYFCSTYGLGLQYPKPPIQPLNLGSCIIRINNII